WITPAVSRVRNFPSTSTIPISCGAAVYHESEVALPFVANTCTVDVDCLATTTCVPPKSPAPTYTPVISDLVESLRSTMFNSAPVVLLYVRHCKDPASVHWAITMLVPSLPIPGRYVSGFVFEYPKSGYSHSRFFTQSKSVTNTNARYPTRC